MLIDANWNELSCQEQQDFLRLLFTKHLRTSLCLHEAVLTRPPVFVPCYQLGGWGARQDKARDNAGARIYGNRVKRRGQRCW